MVLSIVDHATNFHVLRYVHKRSPTEVAALFEEAWAGVFGPPKQVLYDHGSEFTKEFEVLLEQVGAVATVVPVECHWQGGVVERHGGIAKTIMRKVTEHHSVTDDEGFRCALQETASAKNFLARKNGFSPTQWVFGYDHALPGAALDRPEDIAVHDHIQTGGQFAAKWDVRETARITWLQLDNSNRIRRAILAKPKLQKETFVTGNGVFLSSTVVRSSKSLS